MSICLKNSSQKRLYALFYVCAAFSKLFCSLVSFFITHLEKTFLQEELLLPIENLHLLICQMEKRNQSVKKFYSKLKTFFNLLDPIFGLGSNMEWKIHIWLHLQIKNWVQFKNGWCTHQARRKMLKTGGARCMKGVLKMNLRVHF